MAQFRARARTVDMLGRQQIAGIPTAISELFKNAHDAYATQVLVDFYRPEQLFVLRDNGLGMTVQDIMEKWLVLGTESKLAGHDELAPVASALNLPTRRPTGEKGIGRLAIAAIGPQLLLLTRAKRLDGVRPTVAAFINWSLFALPRISLDEIDIPVKEFPHGALPAAEDIADMVKVVQLNLNRIRHRVSQNDASEIDAQLNRVSFDPAALQGRFQGGVLEGTATGTQFYVQPTDAMLELALDAAPERRRIGDLQKTLMGFTNTMIPDGDEPPIQAEFRDHLSLDFHQSVIGRAEFFTPAEFKAADHHFRGVFDEYGQFAGTVSIYGGHPEDHAIAWTGAKGKPTECGPFAIDFAYMQGVERESRVAREQWHDLIRKLDMMGGLYIYRNGIRILPYGNTDYDFLRLEERRNLGAGYYFFSYRRIFGVIDLPPESSSRLIEKAGREGFRENRAYRQFRAILENFFIQMAADYFRDETTRGRHYRQTKESLEQQTRARDRQRKRSREQRRELASTLARKAAEIGSHVPDKAAEDIVAILTASLARSDHIADRDSRYAAIRRAEDQARQQMARLRGEFRLPRPRGFGLTKALRRDLNAYRAEYVRLEEDVFKPALVQLELALSTALENMDADMTRRRRLDASTRATWDIARSHVVSKERSAQTWLHDTSEKVSSTIRQAIMNFDATLVDVEQRLQHTDLTQLTDAEFVQFQLSLNSEINTSALEKQDLLDAISRQLAEMAITPDASGQLISSLDFAASMEEDLFALQERAEADLELVQLGMAIEIIDHEFQAAIRSVRNNLRRLRTWAERNDQLLDVYRGIRTNFEHLDSYLTLFTPLHRRLYRTEIEIKGSEIAKFLFDLFRERLARHCIDAMATQAFRSHRVTGYPSTFYPVFVNIVDNAIFWLQDHPRPRVIRLDAEGEAMIVADNGPGVASRDREAIFEMGFTRKPGGRGLGLYISQDVLKKAGYDLTIDDPVKGWGAVFRIQPAGKTNG